MEKNGVLLEWMDFKMFALKFTHTPATVIIFSIAD